MWREHLRMAARSLRANKFRSMLTVLSITIGAFAIVLMSSLAESGLSTLKRGVEDLGGARLLLIAPRAAEKASALEQAAYKTGFDSADRAAILEGVPHVEERAMYAALDTTDAISDEGKTARTDFVAADGEFLDVFHMPVGRGLGITDDDNRERAAVCVVGPKTAPKLWKGDPIGHMLTIGAARCRVVGVLAENPTFGVNFGFEWEDLVVMPLEAVAGVEPTTRTEAIIVVKTDGARNNDAVKRIVNARLAYRHHGIDDFQLYDFSTIMKKFGAMFAVMEAIVGLIAGVALFIGGVGVMNMMLVSVSERVREIGIRKAVGARPWDIGAQFLAESLLLSLLGGVLGAGLGVVFALGASFAISHALKTWMTEVSTGATAAALLVSVAIGLVFGYVPAKRASKLEPIVAIRG